MTKKEIQDALKAATDKAAKLNALAERSEEQDTELDGAIAEAEQLAGQLEAIREREAADKERQAKIGSLASKVGQLTPLAGKKTPIGEPKFTSQKLAAEDDPKGGFKSPREMLMAVMDHSLRIRTDERLLPLKAAAGSDEQGEYADAYGGFLVPPGLLPGIQMISAEADPTASYCTNIPMSAPVVRINARTDKNHTSSVSGGLRVYRRQETDDVSSSRMQMEQVTLNAHSLMGVAYASEEILTDSPVSFAALLEAGFRDEFGATILNEKLRGSGAGCFEGILNAPCTVSVSKETGQTAATVVYENIVKMAARCWGYDQAIWIANHDIKPQLAQLAFVSGTQGTPFYFGSAREGFPSTLLGRPIFFTEFCETLGTVGDLICGNWSQYLVGTLAGMGSAESMHVRFLNHERAFKFFMRNDGRCWWRSALTPKKGSNTLSPFVTLATRS